MAATDDIKQFASQWEKLKANDSARNSLIERLIAVVNEREIEILNLKEKIETQEFHERHYKKQEKENKQSIARLESSPFVIVLVDGDNSLFLDKYIEAGADGAHQAAQLLHKDLEEHLKENTDFKSHWSLLIRIYVNQFGLSEAYRRAGITEARTVRDFFVGFNRELPFAEFVDVGSDKEAADNKIRENLKLFYDNGGCRHIVLAGSADRGYVSFLRQFSAHSDKLTLVESIPFPASFRELAVHFQTTRLDNIFRTEKLNTDEPAPGALPAFAPARPPSNGLVWGQSRKIVNTEAVADRSSSPLIVSASQSKIDDLNRRNGTPERRIPMNGKGKRVDGPLPPRDPSLVKELKPLKLCIKHYLSNCRNGEYCQYEHDRKLNDRQKIALAHLAREAGCSDGPHCLDRDCVKGHHCPMGKQCFFGEKCKHDAELHLSEADKVIVKEI